MNANGGRELEDTCEERPRTLLLSLRQKVVAGATMYLALCTALFVAALPALAESWDRIRLGSEGLEDSVTVHLYVSDQSFQIPQADIVIRLDDREVFHQICDVNLSGSIVWPQHNWLTAELSVRRGQHLLEAEELATGTTGKARLNATTEIWVVVDFWYYPQTQDRPSFTIAVYNHTIAFS